jgi:hypothetical protein
MEPQGKKTLRLPGLPTKHELRFVLGRLLESGSYEQVAANGREALTLYSYDCTISQAKLGRYFLYFQLEPFSAHKLRISVHRCRDLPFHTCNPHLCPLHLPSCLRSSHTARCAAKYGQQERSTNAIDCVVLFIMTALPVASRNTPSSSTSP